LTYSRSNPLPVLTLTIALLFALAGCSNSEPAVESVRPVKVVAAKVPDHILRASFPGRAEPVKEVNLAFEAPGTLEKLPVQVGDAVKKGQLVAQLNQQSYRARLDATQARYRKAVNDERRLRQLLQAGNAPQTLYDDAQTNLDVLASQLALDEKTLADTTLRAPFDGQVSAIYLDNYTFVGASIPVARIVDMSKIEMWVDIPEFFAVIGRQMDSHDIYVVFDAYPEHRIPAKIKEWGQEASRETRTFPVSLIIDQPETFRILPGMSGMAFAGGSLKTLNLENLVEVPPSALFTPVGESSHSVWVVTDGKVQRREVKVHRANKQGLLIKAGLQAGEQVVVAGVHSVLDGQQVRILGEEATR